MRTRQVSTSDALRAVGCAALASAVILGTGAAEASSLLTVTTYDMPNGDGTAHGGAFNYWDTGYSNCVANDCMIDGLSGSNLSGGVGRLTDGVIATDPFYMAPSEYVGWLENPTIVFNFASNVTVGEVKLYVDNSHVGGVTAPDFVTIDGTNYANPTWQFATPPETIDITGLHLTGKSVTVTLDNPVEWVFMSEAQFYAGAVPEPSSWAMALVGFAGLSYAGLRRRREARLAI
jgi:hypothetical protein